MIQTMFTVALGGAIGSTLRYLVNVASGRLLGIGFPYGTMFVNIVGSFVMGVLAVFLAGRSGSWHVPFLMTGILGGFTTFSAFSLDAMVLYDGGRPGLAAFYVIASVVVGLMALVAGMALAKGYFA
ncbi:fluoride efflux transporter CrcB [Sinirhodobacter populi]|uniref:Fluoride-specific ion channel FluC n=1 Tax=Paenirhodobacter populi TaxID=2306993 RepID=A0A443JZY5_9RHOB|nr:fluoride efflux transporter CrcB [Sinirhodobacter populi]RWR26087.1 fluoride efflux transporter CrcB [Sinirhodobacter populi]